MLGLSLLTLHSSIRGEWWAIPEAEGSPAIGLIVALVIATALTLLFAILLWLTGLRHNWARWALLAYLVFGWFMVATEFPRSISATPFAAAFDVLFTLAELRAVYLLFSGAGAQWFSRSNAS